MQERNSIKNIMSKIKTRILDGNRKPPSLASVVFTTILFWVFYVMVFPRLSLVYKIVGFIVVLLFTGKEMAVAIRRFINKNQAFQYGDEYRDEYIDEYGDSYGEYDKYDDPHETGSNTFGEKTDDHVEKIEDKEREENAYDRL